MLSRTKSGTLMRRVGATIALPNTGGPLASPSSLYSTEGGGDEGKLAAGSCTASPASSTAGTPVKVGRVKGVRRRPSAAKHEPLPPSPMPLEELIQHRTNKASEAAAPGNVTIEENAVPMQSRGDQAGQGESSGHYHRRNSQPTSSLHTSEYGVGAPIHMFCFGDLIPNAPSSPTPHLQKREEGSTPIITKWRKTVLAFQQHAAAAGDDHERSSKPIEVEKIVPQIRHVDSQGKSVWRRVIERLVGEEGDGQSSGWQSISPFGRWGSKPMSKERAETIHSVYQLLHELIQLAGTQSNAPMIVGDTAPIDGSATALTSLIQLATFTRSHLLSGGSADDDGWQVHAHVLCTLAAIAASKGCYSTAVDCMENELLPLCEDRCIESSTAHLRNLHGWCCAAMGRLDDAKHSIAAAVRIATVSAGGKGSGRGASLSLSRARSVADETDAPKMAKPSSQQVPQLTGAVALSSLAELNSSVFTQPLDYPNLCLSQAALSYNCRDYKEAASILSSTVLSKRCQVEEGAARYDALLLYGRCLRKLEGRSDDAIAALEAAADLERTLGIDAITNIDGSGFITCQSGEPGLTHRQHINSYLSSAEYELALVYHYDYIIPTSSRTSKHPTAALAKKALTYYDRATERLRAIIEHSQRMGSHWEELDSSPAAEAQRARHAVALQEAYLVYGTILHDAGLLYEGMGGASSAGFSLYSYASQSACGVLVECLRALDAAGRHHQTASIRLSLARCLLAASQTQSAMTELAEALSILLGTKAVEDGTVHYEDHPKKYLQSPQIVANRTTAYVSVGEVHAHIAHLYHFNVPASTDQETTTTVAALAERHYLQALDYSNINVYGLTAESVLGTSPPPPATPAVQEVDPSTSFVNPDGTVVHFAFPPPSPYPMPVGVMCWMLEGYAQLLVSRSEFSLASTILRALTVIDEHHKRQSQKLGSDGVAANANGAWVGGLSVTAYTLLAHCMEQLPGQGFTSQDATIIYKALLQTPASYLAPLQKFELLRRFAMAAVTAEDYASAADLFEGAIALVSTSPEQYIMYAQCLARLPNPNYEHVTKQYELGLAALELHEAVAMNRDEANTRAATIDRLGTDSRLPVEEVSGAVSAVAYDDYLCESGFKHDPFYVYCECALYLQTVKMDGKAAEVCYRRALKAFDSSRTSPENYIQVLINYAMLRHQSFEDIKGAINLYHLAVQFAPTSPEVRLTFAEYLLSQGLHAESLKQILPLVSPAPASEAETSTGSVPDATTSMSAAEALAAATAALEATHEGNTGPGVQLSAVHATRLHSLLMALKALVTPEDCDGVTISFLTATGIPIPLIREGRWWIPLVLDAVTQAADPGHSLAYLGYLTSRTLHYAVARAGYNILLDKFPINASVLLGAASFHGDIVLERQKAKRLLTKALRLEPQSLAVILTFAQFLTTQYPTRFEEADAMYRYAMSVQEEAEVNRSLAVGDNLPPRDTAVVFSHLTYLTEYRWCPSTAFKMFAKELVAHPDSTHLHGSYAQLLDRYASTKGKSYSGYAALRKAADKHFHKALELAPDKAAPHFAYGSHLSRHRRFAESVRHLQRAAAIEPLTPSYLESCANALFSWYSHLHNDAASAGEGVGGAGEVGSAFGGFLDSESLTTLLNNSKSSDEDASPSEGIGHQPTSTPAEIASAVVFYYRRLVALDPLSTNYLSGYARFVGEALHRVVESQKLYDAVATLEAAKNRARRESKVLPEAKTNDSLASETAEGAQAPEGVSSPSEPHVVEPEPTPPETKADSGPDVEEPSGSKKP